MYFYTLPTFKLWGKLWGERGVLKTAQCAVLPSEMSFCIKSKSSDRSNGIFLAVAEKTPSVHEKIEAHLSRNFL